MKHVNKGKIHGFTTKGPLMGVSRDFARDQPLDEKIIHQLIASNTPQIQIPALLDFLGGPRYNKHHENDDPKTKEVMIRSILEKGTPTRKREMYSILNTPFYQYIIHDETRNFKRKLSLLYDYPSEFLKGLFVAFLKTGKDKDLPVKFLEFLRRDVTLQLYILPLLKKITSGDGLISIL